MAGDDEQAAKDARVEAARKAYDERDRTAPYEEQFRLWEALWEACDFSWEGLADADWERGEDANFAQELKRWRDGDLQRTLQDYWRPTRPEQRALDQPLTDNEMIALGILQERDGRLWHVLYLPDAKIEVGEVQLVGHIEERLYAAERATIFANPLLLNGVRAAGIDRIVRNWGMFGRRLVDLRARMAELPGWQAPRLRFGNREEWEFAIFSGAAVFSGATFGEEASFLGATFEDGPDFSGATFGDGAKFWEATLGDGASFGYATFGEYAGFDLARFGINVNFVGATFGDEASFSDVAFGEGARFWRASFGNRVAFESAVFGDKAGFGNATFEDNAHFMGATFGDEASFENATFGDRASFWAVTFGGALAFADARFAGAFDADEAKFLGKTDFRAAEIRGHAGFAGCTWPDRPEDHESAFKGCRFRDVADFQVDGFKAFALFDGAEFKGRVLLTDPGEKEEDRLFQKALEETEQAAKRHPTKADARLGALVGGLRVLKMAMAAQGDRDREQRFFRYEVQARAERDPMAVKVAAWLYGWTSDYGASIVRPLCCLFWAWLLFAGLYGVAGLLAGTLHWAPSWEGPSQALQMSLANSFRPFFLLEVPREGSLGFLADLLRRSDGVSLALRLLGALQSLSTIILLFLAGVALRRKFQIS